MLTKYMFRYDMMLIMVATTAATKTTTSIVAPQIPHICVTYQKINNKSSKKSMIDKRDFFLLF